MPVVLSLIEGDRGTFFMGHMIQSAVYVHLSVWVNHHQSMKYERVLGKLFLMVTKDRRAG